jgi:hypothetical protein
MGKILLGTVVGIFIGAFAVEVLKKKSPGTLKAIEEEATRLANAVADAFHEGEAEIDHIINGDIPEEKTV